MARTQHLWILLIVQCFLFKCGHLTVFERRFVISDTQPVPFTSAEDPPELCQCSGARCSWTHDERQIQNHPTQSVTPLQDLTGHYFCSCLIPLVCCCCIDPESRVILKSPEEEAGPDRYINANYIRVRSNIDLYWNSSPWDAQCVSEQCSSGRNLCLVKGSSF